MCFLWYLKSCDRHGHDWQQKVWGVLGEDKCARKGCTAVRVNPAALPPWFRDGSIER